MPSLAISFLYALHFIYNLAGLLHSFWKRLTWVAPQPLKATRRRIPKHLAILLVAESSCPESEDAMTSCVVDVVKWCCTMGIERLTVYEERGILLDCRSQIRDHLLGCDHDDSSGSETEYPLTPPPSDYSESRPISPQGVPLEAETITIQVDTISTRQKADSHKIIFKNLSHEHNHAVRNSFTLHLVSRASSKPTIASVACILATQHHRNTWKGTRTNQDKFTLTSDTLESSLEANLNLPSPDFLISHSFIPLHCQSPLELHGFPPWHIRLTEIYHNRYETPSDASGWTVSNSPPGYARFTETSFRQALDEFARAEMRFGK